MFLLFLGLGKWNLFGGESVFLLRNLVFYLEGFNDIVLYYRWYEIYLKLLRK